MEALVSWGPFASALSNLLVGTVNMKGGQPAPVFPMETGSVRAACCVDVCLVSYTASSPSLRTVMLCMKKT
uniref:Cr1 protein n=1 Tax=Xenopus laevis TaxID=8355 RepID=Q0IH21_XENLA|nr:Cr1 protein [Xenopus laevis]